MKTKTTMWAMLAGASVAIEVASTLRNAVDPALRAAGGHGLELAYFVINEAGAVAWGYSQAFTEGRVESVHVPVEVREACALWLPGWAGRLCAQEWHDEAPGEVEAGVTFDRWRLDHAALPARGDVEFLESATCALLGRNPTETERRAFGESLLACLFDLTPVASADDEAAA